MNRRRVWFRVRGPGYPIYHSGDKTFIKWQQLFAANDASVYGRTHATTFTERHQNKGDMLLGL